MLYQPHKDFQFKNVSYHNLTPQAKRQIDCLAENIYFESAHEPELGKLAVALVTLNRVNSGNYPNDICGVVYQKTKDTHDRTVCQFSWVCMPEFLSKRLTIKSKPLYYDIRDLSVHVFLNYERMEDITQGAMFYHADYVNPGWRLPVNTKIGRHIFYGTAKSKQGV